MPWSFSSFRSYSPESRMREIRQSGLEGGGAGEPALPTPIFAQNPMGPLVLRRRLRLAGHSTHAVGTAHRISTHGSSKQNHVLHLMLRQAGVAGQGMVQKTRF